MTKWSIDVRKSLGHRAQSNNSLRERSWLENGPCALSRQGLRTIVAPRRYKGESFLRVCSSSSLISLNSTVDMFFRPSLLVSVAALLVSVAASPLHPRQSSNTNPAIYQAISTLSQQIHVNIPELSMWWPTLFYEAN